MNKEKVKVLYFVDRLLIGGIQTFILNNIKHINKEKVQIDFLILDDGNEYEAEKSLKEEGYNIYKLNGVWLRSVKDYPNYFSKINEFFKVHNDYKVVHLHSSSKNFYILKSAKKYDIPIRIAHSHNIGFQTKSKAQIILGNVCKPLLKYYATHYFACSEIAGEWLFGKKEVKKGNVKVIHNAVDLNKFKFDEEKRNEIRKELNIQNKLVIGHVGRFSEQKNHSFLIDIFNEIHKMNKDTVLMLIGTGEKEKDIKYKVQKLKLNDSVIFVGFKNEVNQYMSAMDVFVFPSLFEGLGLVLIEAQVNGLKCFTSKGVVPIDAKVSKLLNYIPLELSSDKWADIILNGKTNRMNELNTIKANGYDIKDTANQLENYYSNYNN